MFQEQPSTLNQTQEKPLELESDEIKPLNGAGVALMGMIRTIIEKSSPTKPNKNQNPKSNLKPLPPPLTRGNTLNSPEKSQKISEPKESLNKSRISATSPEKEPVGTAGDYEVLIYYAQSSSFQNRE